MYIEDTNIENIVSDLAVIKEVMSKHDLVLAGQWDYERVTFDKKYVIKEGTYYLRVFGYTVDGDTGTRHADVILKKPVIGKHYYPHGIEYGEEEVFPEALVKDCIATLKSVNEELLPYSIKK